MNNELPDNNDLSSNESDFSNSSGEEELNILI
jgi:hypothetical protein